MRVTITVKPTCNLCGECVNYCPTKVYRIEENKLIYEQEKCIYCKACEPLCPQKAIKVKAEHNTLKHKQTTITKHF
ncbi:MAG: 4Fe-4S binding protein [Zestosphaera sp.]